MEQIMTPVQKDYIMLWAIAAFIGATAAAATWLYIKLAAVFVRTFLT